MSTGRRGVGYQPARHGHQQDVYDEVPPPSGRDVDLDALQSGGRGGGGRRGASRGSARQQPAHSGGRSARFAEPSPTGGEPVTEFHVGVQESKGGAGGEQEVASLPTVPRVHRADHLGMAHTGGLHHVPPGASARRTWQRPADKPLIEAVRDEVLADPEPEVVEHVIQEVKARRAARAEAQRRRQKQQAMLDDIERMRKEREWMKEQEKMEDEEFRRIEEERAAEENAREEAIRKGIRAKEAAQREDRMSQIAAHQAKLKAEKEASLAHDRALVEAAAAAAAAEEEEDKAHYRKRRQEVRKLMEANEGRLKDSKALKRKQQEEDKKLLAAYNQMMDEQAEAREAAISAVYRRHDTMHQMANQRKALEKRRSEEEKARVRREYEAMMERVKAAEEQDRVWKQQERAAMRAALDAQVAAKKRAEEQDKEAEARQKDVFKARAAAAEKEDEEERLAALKRKEWFARQLDKQRAAKAHVAEREEARKRAAAVARLAEVEDDDSVLEEVAQELVARGRGAAAAGLTLTARGPRRDGTGREQWRDEEEQMHRLLASAR